jgi:deoxyribose-phosphate aldolase
MSTPTSADLAAHIHAARARIAAEPVPATTPVEMTGDQLAALIDHTLLKPETTEAQIRQLCAEARQYGFAAVCVNATWIALCVERLAETSVKVCTVAGFPLGATLPMVKAFEAEAALAGGAQEVDMVLNVGRLKSGDWSTVYADVAGVAEAVHAQGGLLKVILETGLLTDDEKVAACVISQEAGADFVKTATGFSGGGATVADIRLMRQVVGPGLGVKASGGVRTAAEALAMVAAGATRIGASAGVRIVQELAGSPGGEPTPVTKETY